LHLFEFEDYSWFPELIRDGGTDFLGFILKELHYYKPAIPLLKNALRLSKSKHIVDTCSGSGKPKRNGIGFSMTYLIGIPKSSKL